MPRRFPPKPLSKTNKEKVIMPRQSSESESFDSDLGEQTDYETATSRSPKHRSSIPKTSSNPKEQPTKRRKQLNPLQREKGFWKNVKTLQARTDNIIPKAPFGRLIRELLVQESTSANKLTYSALTALQEAAEMYLTSLFQDAYCCTLHRQRVTLDKRDMELVRFLRGRSDPGNR